MRQALLAVLLALPLTASAAAKNASLAHVEGPVSVTSGGKQAAAKKGQTLNNGDRVATSKGGTAVVSLPDGSQLKLKESSSIVIDMPGGSIFGATLDAGGVFAQVAKRIVGSEFRVRAGAAVASVRGTEFFTAFGREHKAGRDVWVCVREGAVDVGAGGKKRAVPAGKGVLIKSGTDVDKPQAFEWTKTLNWNMDPKSGGVADGTDLDKAYSDLLDQDYR
jgi:ferric-dicitrate binding protein FerR (iron transport regulator)